MVPGGEAIGVLDLIKYIVKRSKNITSGEIIVYMDNKTVIRNINETVNKESDVTGEAGAMIVAIQDEIEKVSITISIEYSNNKSQPEKIFAQ